MLDAPLDVTSQSLQKGQCLVRTWPKSLCIEADVQHVKSLYKCGACLRVEEHSIARGGIGEVGGAAEGEHQQADGLRCQADLLSRNCQHAC